MSTTYLFGIFYLQGAAVVFFGGVILIACEYRFRHKPVKVGDLYVLLGTTLLSWATVLFLIVEHSIIAVAALASLVEIIGASLWNFRDKEIISACNKAQPMSKEFMPYDAEQHIKSEISRRKKERAHEVAKWVFVILALCIIVEFLRQAILAL